MAQMKQITTPTYKTYKKQATSYETFARTQMKPTTTPAIHYTTLFRMANASGEFEKSIWRLILRLKKTHFPDKGRDRLTTDSFIRIWIS